MKSTHTLLIPNMLPYHFNLGVKLLKNYGYKAEVLNCTDSRVAQTGLKYVHNDICYPAILVVGQFIDAIENGKYDPHKVALMYFQTGVDAAPPIMYPCCAKPLKKPATAMFLL